MEVSSVKRATAAALCWCVAILQYVSTMDAEFVWDDRAAVKSNADLRPDSPWSDLLKHDFWGQDITMKCVCCFGARTCLAMTHSRLAAVSAAHRTRASGLSLWRRTG